MSQGCDLACGAVVMSTCVFLPRGACCLVERGITADDATIYRRLQRFGPDIRSRPDGRRHSWQSLQGQVDGACVRVDGHWFSLWRGARFDPGTTVFSQAVWWRGGSEDRFEEALDTRLIQRNRVAAAGWVGQCVGDQLCHVRLFDPQSG